MPFRVPGSRMNPDSVGLPSQVSSACAVSIHCATCLTLCLAQGDSGTGDSE